MIEPMRVRLSLDEIVHSIFYKENFPSTTENELQISFKTVISFFQPWLSGVLALSNLVLGI